jgi:hypothetical protein
MGLRYLCTKVTRSAAIAASSNNKLNPYRFYSPWTLSTDAGYKIAERYKTLCLRDIWRNESEISLIMLDALFAVIYSSDSTFIINIAYGDKRKDPMTLQPR